LTLCQEFWNLALDFNVLLDRKLEKSEPAAASAFEAPLAVMPRKLGEMLALTCGPGGGDWQWGDSALQIGVTVVQPRRTDSLCPHHASGGTAVARKSPRNSRCAMAVNFRPVHTSQGSILCLGRLCDAMAAFDHPARFHFKIRLVLAARKQVWDSF